MAPRKSGKKSSRRPRRGMRRMKKIRYNTNKVGGPNTATATMTYLTDLDQNEYYEEIVEGINAGANTRIQQIAEQYALYRIAKVVLKFKPLFDTYTPGFTAPGSNPAVVPYLYWIMDRYGDLLAPAGLADPNYFTNQGAKALRFDDKTLTVSFRPNVILDADNRQIKMTPWLSTDDAGATGDWTPSTALHHGVQYAVIGSASGSGTGKCGTVETTVYYQFKNPLYDPPSSSKRTPIRISPTKIKWVDASGGNSLEV